MTLYELHQAISQQLASGHAGLVPGILASGNIHDFYQGIAIGQALTIDAPTLTPADGDPAMTSFVLAGTTTSLGLADAVALRATITFSEELGALYSEAVYEAAAAWALPAVEWFGLERPRFELNVGDGATGPQGVLGGTVSCLPQLFLGLPLPVAGDTWSFEGRLDKPVGIADVIQLAGGINLANSMPPPLNVITGVGVSAVTLSYDTAAGALASLAFTVTQHDADQLFTLFPFLPGFPQAGALQLDFVVLDPVNVRKTLLDFSGKVVFPGTSTPRPTISLSGSLPDFTIRGTLDDNGALLEVDDVLHIILPPSINSGIEGGFRTLSFAADTPNDTCSFAGTFRADWNITVATPLFTVPLAIKELSMTLLRSGGNNGGSFGGVLQVGQDGAADAFQLTLMAVTPINSKDWTYRGSLSDGTISLAALLDTFTNGVFKIPAGSFDLQVGKLEVEISSAGSYHFEIGATMTLPFGIGEVAGHLGVYSDGKLPPRAAVRQDLHLAGARLPRLRGPLLLGDGGEQTPAYRLSAAYRLLGIDWMLTVEMNDKDNYRYFLSLSDTLTGAYLKQPNGDTTVTIRFGDVSVGDIVALLLSWAVPGGPQALSSPWDLLNNIPLNNLELVVNITQQSISVDAPASGGLGLNFGIFTLDGLSLTYQAKQGAASSYGVMVELNGKFLDGSRIPSWDATDPSSAPVPAGSGNKYLDIRLLALGQHVTISGYGSFASVQDAIGAMRALAPPSGDSTLPVGANPAKGQPMFAPHSNWLIGMNFGVLRFGDDQSKGDGAHEAKAGYLLDLSIIFNDPNLYGLRFALDGPAAKALAGLAFEIMYKKVSDSVGMYQAQLALPNAVRQLQFGAAGITLPNFGVQVFTNGDFLVDIGFPYNNDFSVSFAIQVQAGPLPLLGAGGVYFGKLSSATTSLVPATSNGVFNPVIALGLGLQVGLGKDINVGIMQAGFALTVFGIIEGVYAAYNPFDGGDSSDFYLVKGTLGLNGRLYGTINFVIVSADFEVLVQLYVQASYQSHGALPLSIAATVDIRVTVKINLGLFSIKIGLSFSTTVRETLVIGHDDSANAPWNSGKALEGRRNLHLLRALHQPAPRKRRRMTTLKQTAADKLPLTLYFGPAQTVAGKSRRGSLADQTGRIVHLLYIDTGNASFDNLCLELLNWLVASYQPTAPSRATIGATPVTYTDLLDLYHELAGPGAIAPLTVDQIDAFLNDQVAVTIEAADPAEQAEKNVAIFPMPPEVVLTAPGGKSRTLSSFTSCTEQYVKTMRDYFRDLQMQVASDLPAQGRTALRTAGEAMSFNVSVAGLVFQDFFAMLASQLVQYALDAMTGYKYALNGNPDSLSGIVDWANAMRPAGGGEGNQLTFAVLADANRHAPLAGGMTLAIAGCITQVESGTTLQSIVDRYGSGLTVEQLIAANGTTAYLINGGVAITNAAGATIVTQSDSTFASLRATSGWTAADFAAATARLGGLLTNRTMMTLPDLRYTTASGQPDTLQGVASRYGITPSAIANTTANQALGPFFLSSEASPGYLDLPHMYCLTVAAIQQEIRNCNSLRHLAGMASRFLVYGMRLPVGPETGLTFNDPEDQPCAGGDCAMYSVTGQQFELPPLAAGDSAAAGMAPAANAPKWLIDAAGAGVSIAFDDAMIATMNAVLAEARTHGLQLPIESMGIAAQRGEQPVQYDFPQMIAWQADGGVTLPYGAPVPGQKAPTPRIWPFSRSLLACLVGTSRGLPRPKVALKVGSVDPSTGQRVVNDCAYYGYGALLDFHVRKVAGAGNPFTYELVGADELGVLVLERLLAVSSREATPVAALSVLFAPNASSNNDAGLVSNVQADTACFITQANLSTYTNPAGRMALAGAAPPLPGLLDNPYDFLSLLWECSITRSGGYYLYYENITARTGLPDLIFDANGDATLRLLLTYAASGATVEAQRLYDYMNVAITGQQIDPAAEFLFGEATQFAQRVDIGAGDTLAAIAARLNLSAGAAAELLADSQLGAVTLALDGLVYQSRVALPGQDPASIASHYMITLAQLEAANRGRGLDFTQPIPLWTALRIPPVAYAVQTGQAGGTLRAVAAYFGATLPRLSADNADIAGLFAPAAPTVNMAFTNTTTTTPPGCLALALDRANPGKLPDPGSPDYARIYLQQAYNLLTYRLPGNTLHNDAFPATNWGIPVGPVAASAPAALADKIRAVPADDGGADWQYRKSLPLYRILNGSGSSDGGLPPVAGDPYSVLDRVAQVELAWRDLYGNETITPMSDPVLFPDGPGNAPPVLLGYTDVLIALSAWPAMVPQYVLTKAAGAPALSVALYFDPSPYANAADTQQASKDLQVYKSIYYQLCQPALKDRAELTIGFAIETSLLADGAVQLDDAQAGLIRQAVRTVVLYLQNLVDGGGYVPPAGQTCAQVAALLDIAADAWNCWCISTPLPPARLNQEQLFALKVGLAISRNRACVAAPFADDEAVYRSATPIDPYVAKQGGDDKGAYALDAFAAQFEQLFQVAGAYRLKLAAGYDRFTSGAAAGAARKPLWVVRMSSSDAGGIYFGSNGEATFFAPTPLATSLQSETVMLYPWKAGGISGNGAYAASFQGIDMDVWLSAFFAAIDNLLSPELISQAFLVDYLSGTGVLPGILKAKDDLARAYADSRTAPLLQAQAGADTAAARERLRQQLLIRLSEAYKVNTIVSCPMTVSAALNGTEQAIAPRLYGTPVIATAGARAGGKGDEGGRNYSFSSAKLDLNAGGNGELTFLFYARRPGDSAVADFDVGYAVTHLEHDIGPVPGIDGYEASSWLSFLLPPGDDGTAADNPLYTPLGKVAIPIPLRAYPAAPQMRSQAQQQCLPTNPPLSDILLWDYLYGYTSSDVRQDSLHTIVRVNIEEPLLRAAADDDSKKLFRTLAQFIAVRDELSGSFTNYLGKVARQMSGSDETVQMALAGLQSLLGLMSDAARYLPLWRQDGGARIAEQGNHYVITEGASQGRFTVALKPDTSQPSECPDLPLPVMQLQGYDTVAADSEDSWWFVQHGTDRYLTPEDARNIAQRQLSVAGLNLFKYQNAWSAAYFRRNETFGARPAAEGFVYTSPLARFANLLTPLIDHDGDVAVHNPELHVPAPDHVALQPTLQAFFTDLFALAGGRQQLITIQGAYHYPLAQGAGTGEQIVVTQPVLLKPFAPVGTDSAGIAALSAGLADALGIWFKDALPNVDPKHDGSRVGGFTFDLSVFATIGEPEHRMPLLRLRSLALPLRDLDGLPD